MAHVPFLRSHDPEVADIHHRTVARLEAAPEPGGSVGLVHGDAHAGNFLVEDGRITLFDFADCVYGRYVYDVAMVVFYAAVPREDDPEASCDGSSPRSWTGTGSGGRSVGTSCSTSPTT